METQTPDLDLGGQEIDVDSFLATMASPTATSESIKTETPTEVVEESQDQAPQSLSDFKEQAKIYVDLFDTGQVFLYGEYIYPKAIYQDGDLDWLTSNYLYLEKRHQTTLEKKLKETEQVEILAIIERHNFIQHKRKEVPYNNQEKAKLRDALARCLQKWQMQPIDNPFMALVLAIFFVNLPRLQPVMPNVFSWINNQFKPNEAQ